MGPQAPVLDITTAAAGWSRVADVSAILASRRAVAAAIFEEAFNRQHFENVNPALDAYTLHVGGATLSLGPGDLERLVAEWHAGFSDFHFEVHRVVAEGDVVAVHATLHGVHDGEWNGKPPTGAAYSSEHMFFIEFEDDQIVKVRELNDPTGLP